MQAVAALSRGHELFAGAPTRDPLGAPTARPRTTSPSTLPAAVVARSGALTQRLAQSDDADRALRTALAAARADHAHGRAATGTVLDAALADAAPAADTPLGRREAMARMAARLRTQHRHISRSRRRARLLALRLRRLHYRHRRPAAGPTNQPGGRPAVLAAIRKALDIKGIHDPAARARWERGMDLVARRESNYNAGAVNDWDSNAARGTPSKGAWQFIEPTFAAYHQRGTSRDIHNLVAQACAFINYAMGRYGVAADASNLADRIQQADPRRSPKGY
ncbi:transglycosylase SLT domain-containing protein [Mycobacterium avium]